MKECRKILLRNYGNVRGGFQDSGIYETMREERGTLLISKCFTA